jgi:serine/threonine protein kinase
MTYQCSACKRSFAEPGFCPFDGGKLVDGSSDAPTVLSAELRAQSQSETQQVAGPQVGTDFGEKEGTGLRALSALAQGNASVIETMRRRVSEYDRLVGETLDGRYYVQRKIGEGGMGVVFSVKHTVIERPLAIKVLKKDVMRDQAAVKRFIQEARAASRIGHPNIVDVTDFGNTADGMTYQVMELIDGITLSKVIKETAPLSLERVLRVSTQIARALAAAHAKGIVHRDLKPENIFLTEREGRPDFVKIMDFGIAKVAPIEGTTSDGPRITKQGAVFGTPEYMAPEQAAGKSDTDHRVDIYALGTILYEMFVGRVPHKSNSMVRTIAMQMLDPVTPPNKANPNAHVPADMEAVMFKALAKKREDRYQSMNDFLAALEGIQTEAHTVPDLTPPPMTLDAATPPTGTPITAVQTSRRPKGETRQLHEPQFTGSAMPSFDSVYDSPPVEEKQSKVPMLIAGLLMLVLGAGGAVFLIMKMNKSETPVVAKTRDDAAVVALVADAGVEELDAMVVVDVPVDAGVKTSVKTPRDAGVGNTVRPGERKGFVTVEVLTRPGEADVFIGRNYRGPSGVKITERLGTKVKIVCKTAFMKGNVEVTFDGSLTAVMCNASRDRFCAPGLKTPFDDCEENPAGGP